MTAAHCALKCFLPSRFLLDLLGGGGVPRYSPITANGMHMPSGDFLPEVLISEVHVHVWTSAARLPFLRALRRAVLSPSMGLCLVITGSPGIWAASSLLLV